MFGTQCQGLFGQLQRGVPVPLGQLLLHDAAHPDKAGGLIAQQALIGLCGLMRIAGHFRRLRRQQVGKFRIIQIPRRL